METGIPRCVIHILQSRFISKPEPVRCITKLYLHPISATMDGDVVGHHPSRNWMETHTHRHSSADHQHALDDFVHSILVKRIVNPLHGGSNGRAQMGTSHRCARAV